MPTLPLYTPPAVPDACHRVIAPGGYEWWHFDAEGPSGDVVLVVRLGVGFLFPPDYLRSYGRYRRRPTRHPPPLPDDYPAVQCLVFQGGRLLAGDVAHSRREEFSASERRPQVRVGRSEFVREGDGLLRLRLCCTGGPGPTSRSPTVELDLRPSLPHRPHEIAAGADAVPHRWIVADPLCDAEARIVLPGDRGAAGREIRFTGRGYHDHAYGTQPFCLHPVRWVRGRILLPAGALAFRVDGSLNAGDVPPTDLVESDAAGTRSVRAQARALRPAGGRLINKLPDELHVEVAGRDPIRLSEPRVLGSSNGSTWVACAAAVGSQKGRALCEVADYSPKGNA
jgi:hypothetical protein